MEEKKLREHRQRLRQIDRILIPSVRTLVDIAFEPAPRDPLKKESGSVYFPPWVSEVAEAPAESYLVTRSFCAATLLRIWRNRRRFPDLEKKGSLEEKLATVKKLESLARRPESATGRDKQSPLVGTFVPGKASFAACAKRLDSKTYGALNPMTASQVFGVLLEAGERYAHGAMGFLAFFCMVWSMKRQFPPGIAGAGAQLEPWGPSAYVTAKCLLPIQTLQRVCRRRAQLFREIGKTLKELDKLKKRRPDNPDPYTRWRFASALDGLSSTFFAVSRLSSAPEAMEECGKKLLDLADEADCGDEGWLAVQITRLVDKLAKPGRAGAPAWKKLSRLLWDLSRVSTKNEKKIAHLAQRIEKQEVGTNELAKEWRKIRPEREKDVESLRKCYQKAEVQTRKALQSLGQVTAKAAKDAKQVLDEVGIELVDWLGSSSSKSSMTKRWGGTRLKFPDEWKNNAAYWDDLHKAAKEALEVCEKANKVLAKVSKLQSISTGVRQASPKKVQDSISTVIQTNEDMAKFFREEFASNVRWCRGVADREVAHISAKNDTAFSPSELVSATAVAVAWGQTRSRLAVADAVLKATAGAREDGSWRPGKPYYCEGRLLAAVPVTSDTVGTLATAITDYREIEKADTAFARYLDWLERTRSEFTKVVGRGKDGKSIRVSGWSSDRAPGPRRVDLWATAHGINSLLEIRDIVEYRLWQMCKRNFTVLRPRRGLAGIDPLDLELPHGKRLLCRLKREARHVQDDPDFKEAGYSFVLHGPPGSSKSAVAEALASDIWRSPVTGRGMKPRVVRITPADFTRLGESRLDSVARFVFELLESVRGVTVFFDEIDDLLHRRDPEGQPKFMKLVVPAMLNRLQDLREACERQQICVVLATNYVEQIEPALLRKGRIDECFPVVYPDRRSREAMVWRVLWKDRSRESAATEKKVSVARIAEVTRGWPWKDVAGFCKESCEFDGDSGKLLDGWSSRGPSVSDPGYEKRCEPSPISRPLRHEVCAYFKVRAAGDCRDECPEVVSPCPEGRRLSVEH